MRRLRTTAFACVLTLAPTSLCSQQPASPRPASTLHGRVVDAHGRPLVNVEVRLEPAAGGCWPALPFADDRRAPAPLHTDAEGLFASAALPAGPWRLVALPADGRRGAMRLAMPRTGALVLCVDGEPMVARLPVRVLGLGGAPVAGARVAVRGLDAGATAQPAQAFTDAEGRCALPLPAAAWALTAESADGRCGIALGQGWRGGGLAHVSVLLEASGGIDGRLSGVDAARLAGSTIEALRVGSAAPVAGACYALGLATAVRDGTFALRRLPAGPYQLWLRSPNGLCLEQRNVQVRAGEVVSGQWAVEQGHCVAGCVQAANGAPLAGARVTSRRWPQRDQRFLPVALREHWFQELQAEPASVHDPATHAVTATDAHGRYRLEGLPPGRYRLEVLAAGHALGQRDLDTRTAPARTQDFTLAAAGAIQGAAWPTAYRKLALVAAAGGAPERLVGLPYDGTFTLAGVAAGDWRLMQLDASGMEPLATVHVEAGRTAWVDLRRPMPAQLAGRVLRADGSPAVGMVRFDHELAWLDADGGFAFAFEQSLSAMPARSLEACVDGLWRRLPLPAEAAGAPAWRGDLQLGAGTLRVALQDEAGRPCAGQVRVFGPQLSEDLFVDAAGVTLRSLSPGDYSLYGRVDGALVAPRQVTVTAEARADLRCMPAARIDVQVLDEAGRPCPHFRVAVLATANAITGPDTQADEDGIAHLLLSPGRHWIGPAPWLRGGAAPIAVDARTGAVTLATLKLDR